MEGISIPLRILSILLFAGAFQVSGDETCPYDPDIFLNAAQTIRKYGYPAEAHTLQTEDGYLLSMHRIPRGRSAPAGPAPGAAAPWMGAAAAAPKLPVLLHHGLFGTSYAWLLGGPRRGLAYLLADAGYDVWIANVRGNFYSKAHISLPTCSSSPFWNFSFHEVATRDLPAEMDYVLRATGQAQLHYVGHSMGTTALLALAAARPAEAAAKIASAFALAPVAFMSHLRSPIRLLAPFASDAEYLLHLLGEGELLPDSKFMRYIAKYGCELLPINKTLCRHLAFIVCGFDAEEYDPKIVPLLINHHSGGASTQTVVHYAQLINSGMFRQFDYGLTENLKRYNSTEPPEYDLSKINVPMHLYYASNDWLAAVVDVEKLYDDLQCTKSKYLVPLPSFDHLDFISAKHVKKLLYDELLKDLSLDQYRLWYESNFVR